MQFYIILKCIIDFLYVSFSDNDYLKQTIPVGCGATHSSKLGPELDDTGFDLEAVLQDVAAKKVLSNLRIDSDRLTLAEVIGHGQSVQASTYICNN